MADSPNPQLPDLTAGIAADSLSSGGSVLGRVREDEVLLVRSGDRFFAIGPYCTHYHGALADGLVVDDTVRCPLHHACFSLETGAMLRAPALDPIPCWRVERVGNSVIVRDKLEPHTESRSSDSSRHHHHRRRRSWSRGSEHAAPGRLRWCDHHDQRRPGSTC
jgi:nitrite reductase/ring-hydroxylating ferredoxin subunit